MVNETNSTLLNEGGVTDLCKLAITQLKTRADPSLYLLRITLAPHDSSRTKASVCSKHWARKGPCP